MISRLKTAAVLLMIPGAFACTCEQRQINHDGLNRSYLLHLPKPQPEGSVPLVIALHGRLGTANGQRRSTGFNDLADRDGAVVVYPDGIDRSWADARDVSPASQQNVDDQDFLLALIDAVDNEITIDRDRISIMGISNGGFMTQTMACSHGEVFASAASVISTIPSNIAEHCQPSQALSVLFMNGTEDPLVPFVGGEVNSDVGGEIISSDDAVAHWVAHNSCAAASNQQRVDDKDDGTAVQISLYNDCESHSQVHYYVVEGGGHTWPNGSQYAPEGMVGKVSKEIEAMPIIWDFLLAQRRDTNSD